MPSARLLTTPSRLPLAPQIPGAGGPSQPLTGSGRGTALRVERLTARAMLRVERLAGLDGESGGQAVGCSRRAVDPSNAYRVELRIRFEVSRRLGYLTITPSRRLGITYHEMEDGAETPRYVFINLTRFHNDTWRGKTTGGLKVRFSVLEDRDGDFRVALERASLLPVSVSVGLVGGGGEGVGGVLPGVEDGDGLVVGRPRHNGRGAGGEEATVEEAAAVLAGAAAAAEGDPPFWGAATTG